VSISSGETRTSRLAWLPGFTALVTALCLILLAVTGFYGVFISGRLGGWPLLAHVAVGGVYAVALALLVAFRSETFAFDTTVWAGADRPVGTFRKLFFWLFAAASVALMLTAVMMMMPRFGTAAQNLLIAWHRWAAYTATLAAILGCVAAAGVRRR
jgi:hypothetical protein